MCGIVGFNGKKNSIDILINGLKRLEYRGYDSAGVAINTGDNIAIIKSVGKVSSLEEKVADFEKNHGLDGAIGIGHTRWATHGEANLVNSHPHNVGNITIVHNGIIENFKELKEMLIGKGYKFVSETDTEVACALINWFYQDTHDIKKSLSMFIDEAKGAYAICALVDGNDNLYCIRKDAPLIVASGEDGNYVASDTIAIGSLANKVIYVDNGIIVEVGKDSINLFDKFLSPVEPEFKDMPDFATDIDKGGYEHYMLKEIHEQPRVFKDTTSSYIVDDKICNMPDFSKYNKIFIVACGSAYHTGLVGKNLIEEYAEVPVTVEIASEFRYKKNFYDKNSLVIVVSQSGETADTLASLEMAKEDGVDTLAIVNVPNSSIARSAKHVLLVKAGPEIAVATTKAYSAQVTTFGIIALNIGFDKGLISKEDYIEILKEMKEMPILIENTINNCNYKEIAEAIYKRDDIFFIGRGIDSDLCLEGSLKLKEISYIHSQAYAAGELKHGTISLVDNGTPVISIITDDSLKEKTISNVQEVKSRGAVCIIVTNDDSIKGYDYSVVVPRVHRILQPLLTILPLQLIAYEVARLRDCNIDKPKNLAKSVTVE